MLWSCLQGDWEGDLFSLLKHFVLSIKEHVEHVTTSEESDKAQCGIIDFSEWYEKPNPLNPLNLYVKFRDIHF